MQPFPLDEGTAERILTGRLSPDDVPPGYAGVTQLLHAAATGPARTELAGEGAAVVAMRAAVRRHLPSPSDAKEPAMWSRLLSLKVAGAAAVLLVGAGTAAAATGALPGAGHHGPDTPVVATATTPGAGPGHGDGRADGTTPTVAPTSAPPTTEPPTTEPAKMEPAAASTAGTCRPDHESEPAGAENGHGSKPPATGPSSTEPADSDDAGAAPTVTKTPTPGSPCPTGTESEDPATDQGPTGSADDHPPTSAPPTGASSGANADHGNWSGAAVAVSSGPGGGSWSGGAGSGPPSGRSGGH